MTRVLILYGTTEGQTAKIAEALASAIRAQGVAVDLADASESDPSPEGYDGVLVAASVHAGGYQRSVLLWLRAHAEALRLRKTAFVSVCLGVLQHDPQVNGELALLRDRFLAAARWRPDSVKVVAGALPYTKYNWVKRWLMRRIVRKAGGDIDTARDYEYTDWTDVAGLGHEFAKAVAGAAVSAPAAVPH
jgi:menaquinone-dependent protoporphyrinogen oxidase